MNIIVVGNPNSGKSTIFNSLTGSKQRIGNWSGVTVEKEIGKMSLDGTDFNLIDLPGIYSLTGVNAISQDEQITTKYVAQFDYDLILNVVNAANLERHLYLTTQLLELGKPVIVLLNMLDLAQRNNITIDILGLQQQLQCPVIAMEAHKEIGLNVLTDLLKQNQHRISQFYVPVDPILHNKLEMIKQQLLKEQISKAKVNYYAYRILEGDTSILTNAKAAQLNLDINDDLLIADARYVKIHTIISKVQRIKQSVKTLLTNKLDKIFLHRYAALPIFLAIMYLLFVVAFGVASIFQQFFDETSALLFIKSTSCALKLIHSPPWLIALIAHGLGRGLNTVFAFIPTLACMYFFMAFLETSGYMARAAFIIDRIMRQIGLPGKAFVPLVIGFGCNVPAILATRTLVSEKERLLAILISPFMSCSARLAIYTVFVGLFFPANGHNIIFSIYLCGVLAAILTGYILKKFNFFEQTPFLIELPEYHRPIFKKLVKETLFRLKYFILRAGKIIVPVCMVLGFLDMFTVPDILTANGSKPITILSFIGAKLTPLFAPMGITAANWPATVGLLMGTLAKEVVIGTLNTLYSPLAQAADGNLNFFQNLQESLLSIPHNFILFLQHIIHPLSLSLGEQPDNMISQTIYRSFAGKTGAYAYLLFILLYVPCISTMAVIKQEAGKRLMWFSIWWSLIIAYGTAVLFFQAATFASHPQGSLLWIIIIIFVCVTSAYILCRKTVLAYRFENVT